MHEPFQAPGLAFKNSRFCPHSVFTCSAEISEQTTTVFLHRSVSLRWSVFTARCEIYLWIYFRLISICKQLRAGFNLRPVNVRSVLDKVTLKQVFLQGFPCDYDFITSPLHHFTISPLHHCTISPLHHFATSPFHHFAISTFHHFIISPLHQLTNSQFHHFTISPPRHFTTSPFHHNESQYRLLLSDGKPSETWNTSTK